MLRPTPIQVLTRFLVEIDRDSRIRTTHIAAFMALYKLWLEGGCPEKISIKGKNIMEKAKISSSATWHKTIRSLHEYGYIGYQPTFNRMASTEVRMQVP